MPNGAGGYVTPDSVFGTLVNNGAGLGFTWTNTRGSVVHFSDADGNGNSRLESMADRYGNGVEVSYDGSGHIDAVKSRFQLLEPLPIKFARRTAVLAETARFVDEPYLAVPNSTS